MVTMMEQRKLQSHTLKTSDEQFRTSIIKKLSMWREKALSLTSIISEGLMEGLCSSKRLRQNIYSENTVICSRIVKIRSQLTNGKAMCLDLRGNGKGIITHLLHNWMVRASEWPRNKDPRAPSPADWLKTDFIKRKKNTSKQSKRKLSTKAKTIHLAFHSTQTFPSASLHLAKTSSRPNTHPSGTISTWTPQASPSGKNKTHSPMQSNTTRTLKNSHSIQIHQNRIDQKD